MRTIKFSIFQYDIYYLKNYNEGKVQATLVDLYRMADEDPEAWSRLGEFYPEWSVEEVKLFITKLEDLGSETE